MYKKIALNEHLYILLITFLFFIAYGYSVNSGDQEEHLPLVYKQLQPSLYPNDFFIQQIETREHHIREFYVLFIVALQKLVPLYTLLFLLNFISLFFTVYAFFYITKELTVNKIAPYLAVVIIFFITFKFPVGGNHLQYTQLVCSTLAKGLAALALLCFFRRKFIICFLLLGLSSLFQLLVGLQLCLVLLLCGLFTKSFPIKKAAVLMACYLLASAYLLFPVIFSYFTDHAHHDKELFYKILFDIRNPYHYRIEHTPSLHLAVFGIFYLIGITVLIRSHIYQKKVILPFILFITAFCILQFLCIEIKALNFLVPAQWYKATIWITAILSCTFTVSISEKYFSMITIPVHRLWFVCVPFIILSAFVLFNSKNAHLQHLHGKYQIGHYQKSDLTLMHEWIEQHTPADAVVMSFPTDDSFLCEAKRSMPIEFRALVHDGAFQLAWMNETNKLFNTDVLKMEADMLGSLETLYNFDEHIPYASSVKIDYKLMDRSVYSVLSPDEEIVNKQGQYILIALNR